MSHARENFFNYRYDIHPYYCFDDESLEKALKRSRTGEGWPDLSSFGNDRKYVIASEWSLCTYGSYLDDYANGDDDKFSRWLRHYGFNQISG